MDNKFQLLSDVYFGARYLRFICFENVIVLFDSLSGNFLKKKLRQVYITGTFWLLFFQ